jgi:hypothetical protein
MIRKKEILFSIRFGRTRRSLRGNNRIRGTRHPFTKTVLKDNHILERIE